LEVSFKPGIDGFHGRSGQTFVPVPAKGTKAMILHKVEIPPDSNVTKTLRFKSTE